MSMVVGFFLTPYIINNVGTTGTFTVFLVTSGIGFFFIFFVIKDTTFGKNEKGE